MEALFIGAAKLSLENVCSSGIDKGIESLKERLSNKKLLENDKIVREYLMNHLSDYEYEKIDYFLSKENIYSHDQVSSNWSILSTQTDKIIEDFFRSNPELQYDRTQLTPLLKQAIIDTYQSVMSQLSTDGRVLYNQALRHREQSRTEHQKIEDQIRNLERQLTQSTKKLSYSESLKVYDAISEIINSGNFVSSNSLIQLMETQIDTRDQCFCTALKIYLQTFIGSTSEVTALCVQYSREDSPLDLTENVVTFLLQMEQKSALKILHPKLSNVNLSALVNNYIANDLSDAIKYIINDNDSLKDEYENDEYALWVFANYSKKTGNRSAALTAYSKIEQLHPSMWVRWSIEEIKALLIFTDSIISSTLDITKIKNHLEILRSFFETFDHLCENLRVDFIDTFLTCAEILPLEEFVAHFNLLSIHMREMPQAKKHWYSAHFTDLAKIDEKELRTFCNEVDDNYLWTTYLLHKSISDPESVLTYIEEDKSILHKAYPAIVAYNIALAATQDDSIAYNTVTSLSIPKEFSFLCNVYFAELSVKQSNPNADTYLQAAIDEAMTPSHTIPIIKLRDLVILLIKTNRWLDASNILEKYQNHDPSLMLLRLKILISHKDQSEVCTILIDKLEKTYNDNADFLYCKGVLSEQILLGSGMESFEQAFQLKHCSQFAHATLVARLNRNVFNDDDVLTYAANHSNVDLLHICGLTYVKQGMKEKGFTVLLQALLNCNDNYHEGLYGIFVGEQLGTPEHESPPNKITTGTCCILVNIATEQKQKIWIHNDSIRLPETETKFAGYKHISANDQTTFLLLNQSVGDIIELENNSYEIVAINHGEVIATQYCMQMLLDHGIIKQVQLDPDNFESFFEEVRKMDEDRSKHISEIIKSYRELKPGLSLEMFALATGKSYYKTVYSLLHDNSIPFWSGTDGISIDKNCILTPSIIAVLSSLGIHPPIKNSDQIKFYIPKALRTELELQSREHRNDRTTAFLGFKTDGNPYMIENTPEIIKTSNLYFSCLNEWANWAQVLDPVSPQDYPSQIKSVATAFGVPNIEAIVLAQKMNYLVCCDDLFLRRYMSSLKLDTPTFIDLLIYLNYPFDYILENVIKLLKNNYISPITINFLQWASSYFQNAENEENLEKYSLAMIDLLKTIFKVSESRGYFLAIYQQIIKEKIILHPTLRWIINVNMSEYILQTSKSENQN